MPYIDSNPSSTHSSPRSYPADLDSYYPQQSFAPNNYYRRLSNRTSFSATTLQVSTSTSSHEHDPNERTARPGNAHHHLEFHTALAGSTLPDDSTVKSEFLTNGETDNPTDTNSLKDYTSSTPGLAGGLTRPLKPIERERLAHLDRLKFFLATAPSRWDDAAENAAPTPSLNSMVDDLPGVATPTPFMSGTLPYGPASFGSSYPSQFPPVDSSSRPSTSSSSSNSYRNNTFPPFSNPEPMQQHLSHLRAPSHPALNRFLLPNQEYVTCVLWNGLYHITGTDIVRALVFRFEVTSYRLSKPNFQIHSCFILGFWKTSPQYEEIRRGRL